MPRVWRSGFPRLANVLVGEDDDQIQERGNAMTGEETTIVAGIEIPSTDPVFLPVILGVHIPLSLACVAIGTIAMLSPKRRGRHSTCAHALGRDQTVGYVNSWETPIL